MARTRSNQLTILHTLLKAFRPKYRIHSPKNTQTQGFTLIELLIVVIIAGGIISGLLYLVVELLTADQREASRSQTQQEMQMALDYISAELRQAIYIYDQNCISTTGVGSAGDENFCPGLLNYLPASLSPAQNNYPILAFWKQQPLPSAVREDCDDGDAPTGTPCVAGHAYALVVYTLDTSDSATWDGLARIRRYMLTQFETSSTLPAGYAESSGYVDPGEFNRQFRSWPFYRDDSNPTPINQQAAVGTPTGQAQVLVDFVDDRVRDGATSVVCPGDADNDPATTTADQPYLLTADPTAVKTVANSFYGCVSNQNEAGENRDVLLFIRGNAQGRPAIGITADASAFLPTLQTQVLSRPVLDKAPVE